MKSDKEIKAEVDALTKALKDPNRNWNFSTIRMMRAQITVLEARMTPARVEREYYEDESDPDYQDGDNELWAELDRTSRWMMGEKHQDAPSDGL